MVPSCVDVLPFDFGSDVLRRYAEIRGDDWSYLRRRIRPQLKGTGSKLRAVDLFSGCGGMSLGVLEACEAIGRPLEVALAADFEVSALEVFAGNLPVVSTTTDPIESLFPSELGARLVDSENELVERLGSVDILIGGPPCQGHSDLNNVTRRNDPKNGLYSRMARAAEVLDPRFILIENVAGAFHDKNQVVQSTESHLRSLGYSTALTVLEASELGVPQRRKRLFMFARKGTASLNPEQARTALACSRRDVRWAIGDLEELPAFDLFDEPAMSAEDTRARIEYLFDQNLFDLPDAMRPPCHRDKPHSYKSIYGRLRWEQQAQTITSGFYSMCMGRYVHPSRRRTLTAHEAARIQFFPDFFDFSSVRKRSALARMIGNAVPVKMAYAAALALLETESDPLPR